MLGLLLGGDGGKGAGGRAYDLFLGVGGGYEEAAEEDEGLLFVSFFFPLREQYTARSFCLHRW